MGYNKIRLCCNPLMFKRKTVSSANNATDLFHKFKKYPEIKNKNFRTA